MTTLAAWQTVNLGRPNATYLASDSRITWSGRRGFWDAGRKLFACRTSPDIFGFTGDLLFPSQVLSQIAELADYGVLFQPASPAHKRHELVLAAIREAHGRHHNAPRTDFQILHVGRHGAGLEATFSAWVITYSAAADRWEDNSVAFGPSQPLALGSGGPAVLDKVRLRTIRGEQEANRAVFAAVCEVLAAEADRGSGGVPQLVGLYLDKPAQVFGVIHGGKRYLHGMPATAVHFGSIEWRDESFRAVKGTSLQPKKIGRKLDRARSRQKL